MRTITALCIIMLVIAIALAAMVIGNSTDGSPERSQNVGEAIRQNTQQMDWIRCNATEGMIWSGPIKSGQCVRRGD